MPAEGVRHDFGPIGLGRNWVTDVGGLPLMIRDVAHALIRSGHSESEAIQLAVGAVQRWARGEGKVKPETRARAAAALADWERKKAEAHVEHAGKRDDMGTVTEQSSAGLLLPKTPIPHGPKLDGDVPHAFRGSDLRSCLICGMGVTAKLHLSLPRSVAAREAQGLRSVEGLVPDGYRVGPKGYIHGWIFVGVPLEGHSVRHPHFGTGRVTRVREMGNGRKLVHVRWSGGAASTIHEAYDSPRGAAPRLVPRGDAPSTPRIPLPAPKAEQHPPEVPQPKAEEAPRPAHGYRKLSSKEVEADSFAKQVKSGVRPEYAARRAREYARGRESHLLHDGTLVTFKGRSSADKRKEVLDTVQKLRELSPGLKPHIVSVGEPISGKRFPNGVMGHAVRGGNMIGISNRTLAPDAQAMHDRLVGRGWWMPAGKGSTPVRSVISHEFGHTLDAPGFGGQSGHGDEALAAIRDAQSGEMSTYGKKSDAETFAEAYSEWFQSDGKTKNAAVRKLAKAEGWRA